MDGLAVDASLMTIVMTDTMYVCVMTDTILNSIAAAFAAELYRGRIRGPQRPKKRVRCIPNMDMPIHTSAVCKSIGKQYTNQTCIMFF